MNVSDKVTPPLLVSFLVFLGWLLAALTWNCSTPNDDDVISKPEADGACDCSDHFVPYNPHTVGTGCTWHGVRLRWTSVENVGDTNARETRAKLFAIIVHLLMLTTCLLLISPTLYNCHHRHIEMMGLPEEMIHIQENITSLNRVLDCHGG